MMKPVIAFIFASVLISSCGSDSKKEEKKEEEKKEETSYQNKGITAPVSNANSLASISISGMVSEIKCVGSIRKILSAMMGVVEVEFDFKSTRAINHAKVKFDNSLVNENEMTAAIEKINEGKYKIENIEVYKLEEKSIATNKKKNEEKEVTFSTSSGSSSPGFALPNILDVFDIL